MLNQQNITTKPSERCCLLVWPPVQTAIQIKAKLLSGQGAAATNRNLKTIGQTQEAPKTKGRLLVLFTDEFMGGDPSGKTSAAS